MTHMLRIASIALTVAALWSAEDVQIDTVQVQYRMSSDLIVHLNRYSDVAFDRSVKRFAGEPVYLRMSVANELVAIITDSSTWKGYDSEHIDDVIVESRHSLALRAGRAAYALEWLFGFTLPPVRESTGRALLTDIQRSASRQIAAYSRGVIDIIHAYEIGKDVERLKREFGPRLAGSGINGHLTMREHDSFNALLEQLFPIDKSLTDLEMIVGQRALAVNAETKLLETRPDSAEPTGIFEYRFDTGYGGIIYYFEVKSGVIKKVVRTSLE